MLVLGSDTGTTKSREINNKNYSLREMAIFLNYHGNLNGFHSNLHECSSQHVIGSKLVIKWSKLFFKFNELLLCLD